MGEPCDGRLCEAERRAWREDGFFVRQRAFAAREVEELRDAAERCVARAAAAIASGSRSYAVDGNHYHEAAGATIQLEHGLRSRTIRVIEPFHHLDARMSRLIDDPRLVDPVRELVGDERVALFTDKLNLKRPREGSRFRWHQDAPYWAHFTAELSRLPNVLLALDAAGVHNGCLRIVRGSHRHGLLPGLEGEGTLGPLFTDPRAFDASQQVPVALSAGSLAFFSPYAVHGSEANTSDALRRALVLTYQPGGRRMFKVDAKREAGAVTPQPQRRSASRKASRSSS